MRKMVILDNIHTRVFGVVHGLFNHRGAARANAPDDTLRRSTRTSAGRPVCVRAHKTHQTPRAAARGNASMLAPLTPTSRCYARVPRLD